MAVLQVAMQLVLACGTAPCGTGSVDVPIDAGHHVALGDADEVRVASHWSGAGDARYVPLALPLPRESIVDNVEVQRDASGAVVGVYTRGQEVTIALRIPMQTARDLGALPLPLPQVQGKHRISLDPALSFRPAARLGLAPHRSRSTTRGVSRHDVMRLDESFGSVDDRGLSRYATQGELVAAGGFVGTLQTTRDRRRGLLMWGGAAFVMLVAALAAAHRRLRRGADVERADAVLAREIEELAG